MAELDRAALNDFVNTEIVTFHQARLARLQKLKLDDALGAYAPLIYRSRSLHSTGDLAQAIIADHLADVDKSLLGQLLVSTAIWVSGKLNIIQTVTSNWWGVRSGRS